MDSIDVSLEEVPVRSDFLKEREQKLIKIIESLQEVQTTKGWSSLKSKLFDELTVNLERQISVEAKKETPNIQKLNRLAGELKWAERFSDIQKLEDTFRVELQNVRKQLYGTS